MHSHRIIVKTAAAVLLALAAVSSLPALSPTLVAGVFMESVPKEAPDFGMSGSLGYRFPVGDDGYALINAATYLTGLRSAAENGGVPLDYSRVELTTSIPAGRNRVELSGSAGASLLGAADEELYFDPAWEFRYSFERGRRKVRPYIAYAGAYRYEENGTGGYFSSGAKAGFVYSPEVELRWDLQTGAYLEHYTDRQDLLLDISLSLDLLPGLFWEILLEPSVSWRSSDSSAESAIGAKLPAALRWTPVREWSFQLDGSAGQLYYPETEESTFTGLASLRIDRTIRDSFFFYLEGGGGNNIDPYLRAGIDVSF
jgi:hypothetical protein